MAVLWRRKVSQRRRSNVTVAEAAAKIDNSDFVVFLVDISLCKLQIKPTFKSR
ncbi:hypothetical protein RND71_010028 [Anisodus tanguticus]|uniref:Uncharacterized protein n=1 Tax=Anisodus tanguticus TaxID=243964 RepID=A0AAE1VHT1_9SOLA|nr:hypothetical protein RND71_010028 [Anisodus tanguticus]